MDFLRHCYRAFGIFGSWHLFRLLHCPKSEPERFIDIPARFSGAPLLLRNCAADIGAFYKIFAWKEYHLSPDSLPNPVRSIMDLGSNIGFSLVYFASQFPEAQIVGLEPDSANYKLLKSNTKSISNLNLIRGGAWKKSCSLEIENPGARPDSYRLCECAPNTPGSVSAFSIPELLELHQLKEIDLLKVDIEGAEVQLFSEECEKWLPKVHTLIIELHDDIARRELLPRIGRHFRRQFRQGENYVFVR